MYTLSYTHSDGTEEKLMPTKETVKALWDQFIDEKTKAKPKLMNLKGHFNSIKELEAAEAEIEAEADEAEALFWTARTLYHMNHQQWEKVKSDLKANQSAMTFLFTEGLYEKIPDEHKYKVAVNAYTWWGCSVPEVREAVKKIRLYGDPIFPPELDGVEEIAVYRGSVNGIEGIAYDMSWTTDLKTARFFQWIKQNQKKREGHIYRGKIRRDDVLAYTNRIGQDEIIQYGKVYDVEDITEQVLSGPPEDSVCSYMATVI